jgi:hypothetical protein
LERVTQEDLAGDFGLIEAGGQVGLLVTHLLLVVVADAEAFDEVFERALRIALVVEDGLAVFDDAALLVFIGSAFAPLVEDVVELRGVADVLIMEGVEEIILLGAGNELTEGFFTVGGEGEALDEADFVFALLRQGYGGQSEGSKREEEGKGERFHGRGRLGQ